jgi:hypothetical protein
VKQRRILHLLAAVSAMLVSVGSVEAASSPAKRRVTTTKAKAKSSKPRVATTVPVVVPTTSARVPFRLVNMCDVLNRLDVEGILPPGRFDPIYFAFSSNKEGAWMRPEVQAVQGKNFDRDSVCLLPHQGPGRETQELGLGQYAKGGSGAPWLGGRPFEVKVEGVSHRVYRENPPGSGVLFTCRLFVVLPFGVFLTQVSYNRQAETSAQVDCGPAEELLRRALVLLESGPLVYIDN